MADCFKIGLTVLIAITCLIRFVCSVVSPLQFRDNMVFFLVLIVFLAIEELSFFIRNSFVNNILTIVSL